MNELEKIQNLTDAECVVDTLLKAVRQNECNDCGRCTFGYEGMTQLSMILRDITEKKAKNNDIDLMMELCGLMLTQSSCEKVTGAARAVQYAVENYRPDIEAHIAKKACKSGVCSRFLSLFIQPDKCIGCEECVDACEEDAILGKRKHVHIIQQGECIQCGACVQACKTGAIITVSGKTPPGPQRPVPCRAR